MLNVCPPGVDGRGGVRPLGRGRLGVVLQNIPPYAGNQQQMGEPVRLSEE